MIHKLIKYIYSIVAIIVVFFLILLLHVLSFYSHQADEPADCIVVFGAAVWPGYYGPVASHALADRTLAAASLYRQSLSNCIILSGADSVYGAHEVDIMTDLLLEANVPQEVIVLDRDGTDTFATVEHLDKSKSYILVSNDFHLARIGLLAQRAGLQEAGSPTRPGFALHASEYSSAGRYTREPYFIFRETVALVYYFFYTLI